MNAIEKEIQRIAITCHADGGASWSAFIKDPTENPCLRALLAGPVTLEGMQALWQLISAAPFDEYVANCAWNYLSGYIKKLMGEAEFDAFKAQYPIRFPFNDELRQLLADIKVEADERLRS